MGLINKGYVGMDMVRDTWLNFNTFAKQNPFVILGKLINIILIFSNFFTVVDRLYNNKFIMSVPQLILDVLSDDSQ